MKESNSELSIDNIVDLISNEMEPEYYQGLACMAFHLSISGPKNNAKFAYEYMNYVYENISKKKAHIMAHTGYKRTTVEKFLHDIKQSKLVPARKTDNIFKEFIHNLKAACLLNADNTLPMYGNHSCQSIFEESSVNNKTYTLPSVLSSLEKCGCITIKNQSIVFHRSIPNKALRSDKDLNRQFSNVVLDFASTQIHNKYEDDPNKRLFAVRTDSVDVPDQMLQITTEQLNQILRESNKACFELLEANETLAESEHKTYRIGVQQYVFVTQRGQS